MKSSNGIVELRAADRTFKTGLLNDLLAALARVEPGETLAIIGRAEIDDSLRQWAELTGNAVLAAEPIAEGTRWVVRKGPAPAQSDDAVPIGERLWLYSNFDCNLACDYCCVRSSPQAPKRALPLETVRQILEEAHSLQTKELFITGGEPFLRADIGNLLALCGEHFPTTVLTNGMLFEGKRGADLGALRRDRVAFQISVDSPTPQLHDLHRGAHSWKRALTGIGIAQALGFRVRWAATVRTDEEASAFSKFLDAREVLPSDRVIRREALRGTSTRGTALSRTDLHPEVTFAADGVYYHPVGADDADLRVRTELFPVRESIDAVRHIFEEERQTHLRAAAAFRCA